MSSIKKRLSILEKTKRELFLLLRNKEDKDLTNNELEILFMLSFEKCVTDLVSVNLTTKIEK